jgi:hypothetical protein
MAGRFAHSAPIRISIPTDRRYAGKLKYESIDFDIAAPLSSEKAIVGGLYKLVRCAHIPRTNSSLRGSYGPLVLYFAKPNAPFSITIHGGTDSPKDQLYNPDYGLAMHDHDLEKLADAMIDDKCPQSILIEAEELGWLAKFRRSRVAFNKWPRSTHKSLPTKLETIREQRRPQYGDDELQHNDLFWIALHCDHVENSRSNPERDEPFTPGGGGFGGAGATGSFDEPVDSKIASTNTGMKAAVGVGAIIGSSAIADSDEEAARAERARQFVFGSKPNPLEPKTDPVVDNDESASKDIDAGAKIITETKSEPTPTETNVEVKVDNDTKVESNYSAPAESTYSAPSDTGSVGGSVGE